MAAVTWQFEIRKVVQRMIKKKKRIHEFVCLRERLFREDFPRNPGKGVGFFVCVYKSQWLPISEIWGASLSRDRGIKVIGTP